VTVSALEGGILPSYGHAAVCAHEPAFGSRNHLVDTQCELGICQFRGVGVHFASRRLQGMWVSGVWASGVTLSLSISLRAHESTLGGGGVRTAGSHKFETASREE